MSKTLVKIVEKIKKIFHCKTWQVEAGIVFLVLVIVWYCASRTPMEIIGTLAVWVTFMYTSVANRLEEAEVKRVHAGSPMLVNCYRWLSRYLYIKESLWFLYFALLGAWSALAGVLIFLCYGPWRKIWRKYHPSDR